MTGFIDEQFVFNGAAAELSEIAAGCQKFGLVCTEQGEFDKFTMAVAIFGVILGVICTIVFQYTRRKTNERIAQKEVEEEAELRAEQERESLRGR